MKFDAPAVFITARTKSSDTGEYISEDGGVTFEHVETLQGEDWNQSDKFNAFLPLVRSSATIILLDPL